MKIRCLLRMSALGLLLCAVECSAPNENPQAMLEVSPAELQFDPQSAAANVISVKSTIAWRASTTEPALTFFPAEGSGDGEIRITAAPAGKTTLLTVMAGEGSDAIMREVIVHYRQPPVPERVVYADDLDGKLFTGSIWATADSSWQNPTGSGAEQIGYTSAQAQVRNDHFGSGAVGSGGNYVRLFFDGRPEPMFLVEGISLPEGVRDFTLSMSAAFRTEHCDIAVKADAGPWVPLQYDGVSTYNTWGILSVGLTLSEAAHTLSLRLTPRGEKQPYGDNFDDLKLVEGGGGQRVAVRSDPVRWAELPSNYEVPGADRFTYTHWTTTVKSGQRVRNFSYCYDTRRHNPVWVAYPLHACYGEGGFGRTDPDPWAPDPALDASLQSKIYAHNVSDIHQFWTTDWAVEGGYWSKGHLCMSRERGGAGTQINIQTFYPTNIAPQAAVPSTFASIWSYVESVLSGTRNRRNTITADDGYTNINIVADTLYVVAGCYYEHDRWVERDASNWGDLSADSKPCIVPTHQFKLALRTRSGITGRPVSECSADELQAVGFWIENRTTDPATDAELRRFAVPVRFVEQKMGVTFFPDIPAEVKEYYDPEVWGF